MRTPPAARLTAFVSALALILGAAVLIPLMTPSQAQAAPACPAVQFVGVRGSGERNSDGAGYGKTVNDVRLKVLDRYPNAGTFFIDYQAIPVNVLDPRYSARYKVSVADGVSKLGLFLTRFTARCRTTPVVLVGYSQGAHVAGDVYQTTSAYIRSKIVGLVLIGDPRFNPNQPQVNFGDFDSTKKGIWQLPGGGAMRSFTSDRFPFVRSYCTSGDPVCNYSLANAATCAPGGGSCAHMYYVEFGYTRQAAAWLISRLGGSAVGGQWAQNGFSADRSGANPDETTISASNVSALRSAWQYAESAGSALSRQVVAGGHVYLVSATFSPLSSRLVSINLASGAKEWERVLAGNTNTRAPTVSNGRVLIETTAGLYAFRAIDGAPLWNVPSVTLSGCNGGTMAVDGATAYVASAYAVNSIDTETGRVQWSTTTNDLCLTGIAASAGRVFAVARQAVSPPTPQGGAMRAFDARTGGALWTTLTPVTMDGNPAAGNGMVYAGTQYASQGMLAFDGATGAIRWRRTDMTGSIQAPAVTAGAVIVTSGQFATQPTVRAVNPQTGANIWSTTITNAIADGDPVVANGLIYFGSRGEQRAVHVVRLDNGRRVADLPFGEGVSNYAISPIVVDGMVLASMRYDTGTSSATTLLAFRLS